MLQWVFCFAFVKNGVCGRCCRGGPWAVSGHGFAFVYVILRGIRFAYSNFCCTFAQVISIMDENISISAGPAVDERKQGGMTLRTEGLVKRGEYLRTFTFYNVVFLVLLLFIHAGITCVLS